MNQNQKCGILPNSSLRKLFSFFLFLSSFFLFSIQSSFAQYQKTQRAVYQKMGSYVNAYYESLPVDYAANPTKKYPLLIFIHGKGELGNGSTTQLPLVLRNGPPKLLNQGVFPASFNVGGQSHSFIVISPQINTYNYSLSTTFISQILASCQSKYRVDEQRIYITGLSMGGMIGWRYIGDNKASADKIAASVLVCSGASSTVSRITNIATSKLPVWLTNNSGDPIISAATATAAVTALNAFIPAPPKALLSIFNATGHDAWTKTYDPAFKQGNLNVYEWMLSYKRGTSSEPVPAPVSLTANAGSNQTITLPVSSVTVDGSVKSTYPAGTTILWKKMAGPATGTITSPTSLKTTITGLTTAGDYRFALMLTDSKGNVSTSSMHVIVNPAASGSTIALKSSAGANQTIRLPVNSVTADGAKSTYPAGTTILWRKMAGPATGTITNPASLKTTITGLTTAGDYRFALMLTDSKGNISTSSMHVIVNAAATSTGTTTLKSVAGSSQIITLPNSSVTLDGTGSTGPAGLTHLWKQTSGPKTATIGSIYSIKTTVTGLTTAGTYSFQLTLKDTNGNIAISTVNIIVNAAATTLLKSVAGNNQTITLPASSVTLDGTGSSGPVDVTHLWKQTGGPKTATIGSIYSIRTTVTGLTTAGTYSFQLTLKDTKGNIATSTVQIIVNGTASTSSKSSSSGVVELKANAGGNQTIVQPASSATLDGTRSTWPSSSGTTHFWRQFNGPATASIAHPYSIKAAVSGLTKPGDYQFQIVLTDSKGNKSTASTHIVVEAALSARLSSLADVAETENIAAQTPENLLLTNGEDLKVNINPNPVQSDMNVRIDGKATGRASVVVYNVQGQLLFQQAFVKDNSGSVNKSFNISKLPAGIYVVQVIVGDKYKQIMRVVKQ
ncbi:PKD domain-containing protein [Agriterribacter humi]|uniref:PKD domain-containing protein n=1 Tax=Agriterribacter humi TaxID=1104781 RepID=UPI0012657827|nr:T9SS type A sorting domain-containing protein [Agriterribacter humi]